MIPILYNALETVFTSNGMGRLTDCISCTVTEERNGIFECEFTYPITGKWYDYLINYTCFVGVIHDDNHDIQPFEVYRHSDPLDGIVTFNAHHISYNLNNVIVNDIDADNVTDAFDQFKTKNLTGNPFSFWTDKTASGNFKVTAPDNVRSLLSGQQGSILDVYGTGEYEFDKYTVKLHLHRGYDRGVTIRYGKNLADINRTYDASGIFNGVAPFWTDSEGNTVTLPNGYVANVMGSQIFPWEETINGDVMQDGRGTDIDFAHFILKAVPLDLSQDFEEQPTVEQLRTAAEAYLANNRPWLANDNIAINFVQLWQSPEYEDVAALQRVSLCDTVSVYYPEMQIATSAEVIRIVYNVLAERYDEMELGDAKATLSDSLESSFVTKTEMETVARSFVDEAVEYATEMITGGLGGYVVMNLNAAGQPQEILIMDTDNMMTAVNVIRMNKNGIGFSTTGYEGPFTSAWTIDGHFNADFITTGTMLANRIYGGTLTVGGLNNEAGVFEIRDADGTVVVRGDNQGLLTKSLTAQDYMSISGGAGSYFKMPWVDAESGEDCYIQISSSGLEYALGDSEIYLEYGAAGYYYGGQLYFSAPTINASGYVSALGALFTDSTHTDGAYYGAGGINVSIADSYSPSGYERSGGAEITGQSADINNLQAYGYLKVIGDFDVINGHKNRVVETREYGQRRLSAYETASPMFGDVGEGIIDNTGFCYVFLDAVFAEVINTSQYQVFLQKYGQGDLWVAERKAGYFVVQGTAGLNFGWELKAKQTDFSDERLERYTDPHDAIERTDYGRLAVDFLKELEEGRKTA